MDLSGIAILIPAYKPDERLNTLIVALLDSGFTNIVVVNDGSDEEQAPYFIEAASRGAHVIAHEKNLGKGAALKTGLRHIITTGAVPVITADADGQHTPGDIVKIAEALLEYPHSLILGVRDKKEMPLRTKIGNVMTAFFFGMLTGHWIADTQTGLRGLPAFSLAEFETLTGDRYEYEMNMLISARHHNVTVQQVPISTVYFENNAGSHFRSIRDGMRVYRLMFKQVLAFMGSSVVATVADVTIYTLLQALFPHLLFLSITVARIISSSINFVLNRSVVFRAQRDARAVLRFVLLVAVMLGANYYLNLAFQSLGMPSLLSKILADFILFFLNYNVQQSFIFRRKA